MLPKVELSQIRNTGEMVDDSILFFKQNWKPLLKSYFSICGFFWAAGIVTAIFRQTHKAKLQEFNDSNFDWQNILPYFFSYLHLIIILLTILSYMALYKEKGKEAPSVEEVWGYVKYYFFRLFGSSIIFLVLIAVGTLFCVLPGIYFVPIVSVMFASMVLENGGLSYSFNRGFHLIKNKWWQVFGVFIVMWFILFAATLLLAIPVAIVAAILLLLTNINHQSATALILTIAAYAFEFLLVLPAIAIGFIYYSLDEQTDDNSFMQRIANLGKRDDSLTQLPSEEY